MPKEVAEKSARELLKELSNLIMNKGDVFQIAETIDKLDRAIKKLEENTNEGNH